MAKKKAKPTGDLPKQETIGERTGVADSDTFGDFVEVRPHVDRQIEAELFPPIPGPLLREILACLIHWPTNWMPLAPTKCSAVREEATRLLTERGLLEARLIIKDDAGREDLESAEFRLSTQGSYARDTLMRGDTESVVGWIFFDKLHGKSETVVEVTNDIPETAWSIGRSPSDWLKIFAKLNVDCRSLKTFRRRRDDGPYREHPDSTTKSVRLALDCLPHSYSDTMTV